MAIVRVGRTAPWRLALGRRAAVEMGPLWTNRSHPRHPALGLASRSCRRWLTLSLPKYSQKPLTLSFPKPYENFVLLKIPTEKSKEAQPKPTPNGRAFPKIFLQKKGSQIGASVRHFVSVPGPLCGHGTRVCGASDRRGQGSGTMDDYLTASTNYLTQSTIFSGGV